MKYLKIADLCIEAQGFDYEYFERRTKEYVCEKSLPDLCVSVEINDTIPIPEGKIFAESGMRKFIITDDGGYCFFDVHEGDCIAVVRADREWKNVSAVLTDISKIGGADNDIRRFYLLGEVFRYRILWYDGLVYHSSTISHNGQGVIFTAASGTGKSTHTGLWLKYYGNCTEIINDDTPALRFIDGSAYLYGTPWSGKTEINKNICVPASGIVFVERSENNSISKLRGIEGYRMLFSGVMTLPVLPEPMERVLSMLEKMCSIPMYVLGCNISREAVDTVKNEIFE